MPANGDNPACDCMYARSSHDIILSNWLQSMFNVILLGGVPGQELTPRHFPKEAAMYIMVA